MAISSPKLTWCIVRLGSDLNWWVEETSDPVHWDTDALSIIDPKQIHHILDLLNSVRKYGLQRDLIDTAFYAFRIEKDLGQGRLRLVRCEESILESEEMLFALPDSLDEDKSPYADLIDHLTKLRVKLLNDMLSFEKNLTIEEIEEEIRDLQQADYLEGKSIHAFKEIMDIMEYMPEGYELDNDDESPKEDNDEDIPDLGEDFELEEEDIEEDETMKWDEDDESFHIEDEGLDEGDEDQDEELVDDDEDFEDDELEERSFRK